MRLPSTTDTFISTEGSTKKQWYTSAGGEADERVQFTLGKQHAMSKRRQPERAAAAQQPKQANSMKAANGCHNAIVPLT